MTGDEATVSLVDVLEEDEELENEASAVLAGSDSEKCSYPEGYVKRQALYACSTCTPKGGEPAGICLACSYKCHEGHDLFELYTKRAIAEEVLQDEEDHEVMDFLEEDVFDEELLGVKTRTKSMRHTQTGEHRLAEKQLNWSSPSPT